jgi:hypothetical protein
MIIGYARISTMEQNLDLRHEALKRAACEKIVEDTVSGGKAIERCNTQHQQSRDQGDQDWPGQGQQGIADRVRHVVAQGRDLASGRFL